MRIRCHSPGLSARTLSLFHAERMIALKRKRATLALAALVCFVSALLIGQTALACGQPGYGYGFCHPGQGYGQAPAAPTNLKVSDRTDTSATVSWKAPRSRANIAGYNVYRDGALVGSTPTTSFKDDTLTPNTMYKWTVKSCTSSGRESAAGKPVSAATYLIVWDYAEWSPGSAPGPILAGLIVKEGAYLGIQAGAVVKLNPGISALVYGRMEATGSKGNPVVFTSAKDKACGGSGVKSSHYWGTIDVKSGGFFTGDYMKIVYGKTLATVRGMLTLTNSEIAYAGKTGIFVDKSGEFDGINLKIHHCCTSASSCKGIDAKGVVNLTSSEIANCAGTGALVQPTGTFNATSVSIKKCGKGVEIRGAVNFILSSVSDCKYGLYFNTANYNGVILNSFLGNDTYGVYNAKSKTVTIDASMNYWGSPLGPSVYDPETKTWSEGGDKVSAGVIYDNWLTEPLE